MRQVCSIVGVRPVPDGRGIGSQGSESRTESGDRKRKQQVELGIMSEFKIFNDLPTRQNPVERNYYPYTQYTGIGLKSCFLTYINIPPCFVARPSIQSNA